MRQNAALVKKAEATVGARLADEKTFDLEHTDMELCDEVYNKILMSNMQDEGQTRNSAILLHGEAGSGKTHIIEYCVRKLREAKDGVVVLRAKGGGYVSDVECIRHLATQIVDRFTSAPNANASFETGMQWLRSLLQDSLKQTTSVVIVLDKLEYFCSRNRQTVLYSLFDIAQEIGVRLTIIATSSSTAVCQMLEKRIQSRFTMRCLRVVIPGTMEELVKAIMSKLRLKPDQIDGKAAFVRQWNERVEAALFARRDEWRGDLEAGKTVQWYVNRKCLPISQLIKQAPRLVTAPEAAAKATTVVAAPQPASPPAVVPDTPSTPARKRRPTAELGGDTEKEVSVEPPAKRFCGAAPLGATWSWPSVQEMQNRPADNVRATVLSGLAEAEHILMLAFFRLRRLKQRRTLALALDEVEQMYTGSGRVNRYNEELYCLAWDNLVRLELVQCSAEPCNAGMEKRYHPCWPEEKVENCYANLIAAVFLPTAKKMKLNPIGQLPAHVLNWMDAALTIE